MSVQWKALIILLLLLISGCSREDNSVLQGFIEGEFIYLSSSVSGNLEQLYVTRGDAVTLGEKLFVLDLMPEQAQLKQTEFKLEEAEQNLANLKKGQRQTILEGLRAQQAQAQAALVLAKQTLMRDQHLYRTKAIGKAKLDDSIANYRSAEEKVKELAANIAEAELGARTHLISAQQAAVDAAKAEVERLRWLLEQKTVYAPLAARVYDTFYKIGEFVPMGQAVVAILAPKDIRLIFYIPEKLLSTLKIGQTVYFRCDNCKEKTQAVIYYIAPQAEYTPPVIYSKDVRYKLVFRVEASMAPEDAVKFNPGQPVDVYVK